MSDTQEKLKEAEYFLKSMFETYFSLKKFKYNLNAFICSARSVTLIMQKEYHKKPGFKKWYSEKQKEMNKDELLRFFNNARKITIHQKPLNLAEMDKLKQKLKSQIPNGWGYAVTSKGECVWITPKGTRVVVFEFNDKTKHLYWFERPPKSFLNVGLKDFNVLTLCRLYHAYLLDLVKEVKEKFGGITHG